MNNIILEFFFITEDYLTTVYEKWYKKTVSFKTISGVKDRDDRITRNMFLLNMTCVLAKDRV